MQPNHEPQHERNATDAEPFAERQGEPSATEWRTVAQVAQLLGMTPRAIQRRCQAGKYVARRVETPKGEAWEIDAASIETTANGTTNATATDHERQAEPFGERTTNHSEPTANRSQVAPGRAGAPAATEADHRADELAARYITRLEGENDFLRRALEQRDRDAAEMRAALREALKSQPRQLTSGNIEAPEPRQVAPQGTTPTDALSPLIEVAAVTPNAKSATPRKEVRALWRVILGIR